MTFLALVAINKVAGQLVDPGVRATLVANFQEQINIQQTAIVAQVGGPNSALGGGLGIFASLTALNQLRSFESIFNTAPVWHPSLSIAKRSTLWWKETQIMD